MALRIAFLTDEFVVERTTSGGLATFLSRVVAALSEAGHTPEVFVRRISDGLPNVVDYQGVRVELVPLEPIRPFRWLWKFENRWLHPPWRGASGYLSTALGLARALERRESEQPFDVVHTTNCSASGLFVQKKKGRLHVVRLSSHRALWWKTDGEYRAAHRLMAFLERLAIRRADVAYAPSRFVADYCRRTGWRRDVQVVRPPAFLQVEPAAVIPDDVPDRYLIHFGQVRPVKGSDLVFDALRLAWREEPNLKLVVAGVVSHPGLRATLERLEEESGGKLVYVGALSREDLYALVARAVASVLPSRADNLPNTVIESILLQTPVIGSNGASVDELVESGKTGKLVEIGDVEGLAEAMVEAWRGQAEWIGKLGEASNGALAMSVEDSLGQLLNLISAARGGGSM